MDSPARSRALVVSFYYASHSSLVLSDSIRAVNPVADTRRRMSSSLGLLSPNGTTLPEYRGSSGNDAACLSCLAAGHAHSNPPKRAHDLLRVLPLSSSCHPKLFSYQFVSFPLAQKIGHSTGMCDNCFSALRPSASVYNELIGAPDRVLALQQRLGFDQ
jgi:hypothetical protein